MTRRERKYLRRAVERLRQNAMHQYIDADHFETMGRSDMAAESIAAAHRFEAEAREMEVRRVTR